MNQWFFSDFNIILQKPTGSGWLRIPEGGRPAGWQGYRLQHGPPEGNHPGQQKLTRPRFPIGRSSYHPCEKRPVFFTRQDRMTEQDHD
jgi:hypothetical protein